MLKGVWRSPQRLAPNRCLASAARRWAAEARAPAHMAAQGEDDAHCRPQHRECVPPGFPRVVWGLWCGEVSAQKSRLDFLYCLFLFK